MKRGAEAQMREAGRRTNFRGTDSAQARNKTHIEEPRQELFQYRVGQLQLTVLPVQKVFGGAENQIKLDVELELVQKAYQFA